MTPAQLNDELKRLYEQMPVNVSQRRDSIAEIIDHRASAVKKADQHRRSEHKEIVMNAIGRLSQHFKGSPSFNDFVLTTFNIGYDLGIDKGRQSGKTELFEILLDSEKEGSGGIFDGRRVRFVEYLVFEWELMRQLKERRSNRDANRSTYGQVVDLEEGVVRKISEDGEAYGQNVDNENGINIYDLEYLIGEDLQNWIVDYMEHYPQID